jgi:hypothetical protein
MRVLRRWRPRSGTLSLAMRPGSVHQPRHAGSRTGPRQTGRLGLHCTLISVSAKPAGSGWSSWPMRSRPRCSGWRSFSTSSCRGWRGGVSAFCRHDDQVRSELTNINIARSRARSPVTSQLQSEPANGAITAVRGVGHTARVAPRRRFRVLGLGQREREKLLTGIATVLGAGAPLIAGGPAMPGGCGQAAASGPSRCRHRELADDRG